MCEEHAVAITPHDAVWRARAILIAAPLVPAIASSASARAMIDESAPTVTLAEMGAKPRNVAAIRAASFFVCTVAIAAYGCSFVVNRADSQCSSSGDCTKFGAGLACVS